MTLAKYNKRYETLIHSDLSTFKNRITIKKDNPF